MSLSTSTMPRVVSSSDLEEAGFTTTQIERLDQLKAQYPYLEFTDSIDEWRRLSFLKWRHRTGRVAE